MRATDIIAKKRDGRELSKEEIEFFIQGYTRDNIPDYQAAAWLMAVYLQGMTDRETLDLTMAMAHSGHMLDLDDVAPFTVDKHSTGGVGDKVSPVVVPLVAACGLPVAKMSGRGLGFTGGTLDKLESIPGYRADLTEAEFKAQLKRIGAVLTGQTVDLAPADRKLYALRDVTATVSTPPLIVSSIISKKIAASTDAILLDVKVGKGAFMKTLEQANLLAKAMVRLATQAGQRAMALIGDMNQPLGHAVGNAVEVKEAIDALHGGGPHDLREHCLTVAAEMLVLGQRAPDSQAGFEIACDALDSGRAWHKFKAMVEAQGGDVSTVEEPEKLPRADLIERVAAPQDGYLAEVDAVEIGMTVVELGGGREKKGAPIDHSVGVVVHHKVGDRVTEGAPLFTIHASDEESYRKARQRVLAAHHFSAEPVEPLPLFYDRVTADSIADKAA